MAHDPVRVDNAAAWLKKARQDLSRVGRCLAAESLDVDDAVFHCQQAAEKALKALLTWHDEPFRKTHDLAALSIQCAEIDGTLKRFTERLDDLTQYAWVFRYPTNLPEPSLAEAEGAAALAEEIVTEIGRRLPVEVVETAGGKRTRS